MRAKARRSLAVMLATWGIFSTLSAQEESAGEDLLLPAEEERPQEPWLDLQEVDTSEAERFQFHGRVDLTYVNFQGENAVDDFDRGDGLPLSPGLFFGYAFLDELEARVEIEWDGLEREIEIDRALLEASLFDDHLDIGLGRDILPFGVERFHYSPSQNVFVDRPAAFRAVYPGTFSDYGVFVGGHWDAPFDWKFRADAAVSLGLQGEFDGEGRSFDPEDNNDNKQFTGRLGVEPFEHLSLGASYLVANYDDDNQLQMDFVGFDVSLDVFDWFLLRAEWVEGLVEQERSAGGSFRRHGLYAQIERRWTLPFEYLRAVEGAFRFDQIDANSNVTDSLDLQRYSVAVAFEVIENLRWKFEYEFNDERGTEISNDGFFSQIEYHW